MSNLRDQRLQEVIYRLSQKSYIGNVLQCMRIAENPQCPTAGVRYDKKLRSIVMIYNPEFFNKLSDTELSAVLTHEIEHVLRKHIFIYTKASIKDHKRLNAAMDLVINQTIEGLPKGCLHVDHFTDKNGKKFPLRESTEVYYDLLDGATNNNPDKGEGQGDGNGLETVDEHNWDDITENEAIEGISDLVKRAQNQYEKAHKTKCRELEDALEVFQKLQTDINYKTLLESTLRSTIPSKDTKKTWTRPSRRYGLVAPGNTRKPLPSVKVYMDTSGSMSAKELNEALNIISDIMRHGVSTIKVGLFHHHLYNNFVYKKTVDFNTIATQSGGTDLTEVFEDIGKNGDQINVIVTDGYYDRPRLPKINADVVFLINNYGNINHCLKDVGKTVQFKVKD